MAVGLAVASGLTCNGKQEKVPAGVDSASVPDGLARFAGAPMLPGNALELVENGAVFAKMAADIAAARSSVNIVTFIWRGEDGPSETVGQALLARAPGVACRIVVDPFGSLKFSRRLEGQLLKSGCVIRRYGFRDNLKNLIFARNHRKVQIVDGRLGITGGFGIWKSWEGNGRTPEEWRDTAVRVVGPVVAQMQRAFEQNWIEAGGDALPPTDYPRLSRAGPSPAAFVASSPRLGLPSPAEVMSHLLVANARRSVWIANSYFIPDEKMRRRLVKKRKSGVEVHVLAPGPVHDVPPVRAAQRATYEQLLHGGVRIFEYEASMMHAKTMVVDGRWVVIGSTNFDQLSFDHLEEGSLVADAPWLAHKLKQHIQEDLRHSKEITREIWDKRDFIPELGRDAVVLFSDWL